ncbi:MAG TPA: hypothetical protein VFT29_15075 [Gemmatimonadaceae bacterium]|nr:hypothetical protein [Gemmatimonadaceae bacterium]
MSGIRQVNGCRVAAMFSLSLLLPLAAGAQPVPRDPIALRPAASLHVSDIFRWDSTATPRREPIVAALLGVLPGLGHAYAGEPKRGLAVAGVWLAGSVAAFGSSNTLVSGTGGVLLLGSQIFSIADAALAVGRFNKRHAGARQAGGRELPTGDRSSESSSTRVPTQGLPAARR